MLPRGILLNTELTKTVIRELHATNIISKKHKKTCCPETGRKKVDSCKKNPPTTKMCKPANECKPAIPPDCSKETAAQCMKQLQEIQKAYRELACERERALKEMQCKPKCEPEPKCEPKCKPNPEPKCEPPPCCPPPKKRLGIITTILSTLGVLFIANVIYCAINNCNKDNQDTEETNENEEEGNE